MRSHALSPQCCCIMYLHGNAEDLGPHGRREPETLEQVVGLHVAGEVDAYPLAEASGLALHALAEGLGVLAGLQVRPLEEFLKELTHADHRALTVSHPEEVEEKGDAVGS